MLLKTIALKGVVISVLLLYALSMLFILFYSLTQAHLVFRYLKSKKNKLSKQDPEMLLYPFVTIQLPVYNEMYVVDRLLDAITSLDYPIDRFEIQVLDDSTDQTSLMILEKSKSIQKKGIRIQHIQRVNRQGFKAGALKEGLSVAEGEFIAVFDADFLPNPDFLKKTIPHFKAPRVGMVQTRWEHLNRNYSLLTRLQAFGLDAHFSVEQVGRNSGGYFINFNGTAGIWRKECILDSGNWSADTLTEDLDLSYRAQLKGWQFVYLENCIAPAELPPVMSAVKTQQYRWTKGGAESAKKHLGHVLRSDLSNKIKWHAFFHLLNSGVFICVFVTAFLSVPILCIKHSYKGLDSAFTFSSLFVSSFIILAVLYWVSSASRIESKWVTLRYFSIHFPLFLSMSMGLSLHNALAVIEGYRGKKSSFIRTPKFNMTSETRGAIANTYLQTGIEKLSVLEAAMCLYFLAGILLAYRLHDYSLLPFHVLLAFGFGAIFYYSYDSKKPLKQPIP
jgi:cellulose synthase/poly-beta-1,6-N-acetylglucosamine synthase-like glycosyltransferase